MPGFEEWVEAFWELSTERQIGMAVGPIPASAITAWIKDNRLTHEASLFRKAIRAMDRAYLDHVEKGSGADRILDGTFKPGMLTGKD